MRARNVIVLMGNGFDIAHGLKTKFSDFAEFYLSQKIVPELVECVRTRKSSHPYFTEYFLGEINRQTNHLNLKELYGFLSHHARRNNTENIGNYLRQDYNLLRDILENQLLIELYRSTEKNWFDIENTYFKNLVPIKENLFETASNSGADLNKINHDFKEIKTAVKTYLKTLTVDFDPKIDAFLNANLNEAEKIYVVNFNYTSTADLYFKDSNFVKINHIHGSLEGDDIIFGYGNDQDRHYQEMKDSEIDGFLEYFKTFDYLNNRNYDRIHEQAIDKFEQYDVCVLGHSLGMTDKTLLSEILNPSKCGRIHLFKRGDYRTDKVKSLESYRRLTYSASRILTEEKALRRKIVNYQDSKYFP